MKRRFCKTRSVFLTVLILAMLVTSVPAFAANGGTASGVTSEMTKASYWQKHTLIDADKVLMTPAEIDKRNSDIVGTSGIFTYDMANFDIRYGETFDADKIIDSLTSEAVPERDLYVDGKLIDNEKYYSKIYKAIKKTGYKGKEVHNQYAVCTRYANVKNIPSDDIVGYSPDDADDEIQLSALLVNEPFVIRQKCVIDGKTFYMGYSHNISGWVNGEDLAICSSKEEWLDSWNVETDGKDFIVVAQDKIVLDSSLFTPYSSKLTLTIGTVLKLVPDDQIPAQIGERGPWNNYIVYIPTRTADGKYKKEIAQIAEHYDVSTGYLPFTQANILDLAFSCLGSRYGWGSMLEAMDCSAYVRNIYKCCGLYLARNTNWQRMTEGTEISLKDCTDEEKTAIIEGLPAGTPLYFSGHTMLYTGTVDGLNYVISDTGSLSDNVGELAVRKMYSVIINPLDVRRKNGLTWLASLESAVVWPYLTRIGDCRIAAEGKADSEGKVSADVTVKYDGKTLKEGKDYVLVYPQEGKVSVIGRGDYVGIQKLDIKNGEENVIFSDVKASDYFADAVKWSVENGVASGISAEKFGPKNFCTRSQMVTFLWRMAGMPEPQSSENPFADVKAGSYYEKAVLWAFENEVTTGASDNAFSPDGPVSRGQAVTFLYRALNAEAGEGSAPFDDVDDGAYYAEAVKWASDNSIAKGVTSSEFRPSDNCSRAQVVTFLYRASL